MLRIFLVRMFLYILGSIRSGNHCSKILNKVFGVDNTVRVSFGLYNTKNEIDKLIMVLKNISNIWNEIL